LTIELLSEKIGHNSFKNIAELDLRNCKIKEIDCLGQGDFKNLKRLNLDNNLLTNIDSFITIPTLKYLSLNSNKIERLLSSDPITSGSGSGLIFGQSSKLDIFEDRQPFILNNLEELYLGGNSILKISDLHLYRFKSLKILYLHGNRISRVCKSGAYPID
jgi:Leucine-rich repeat (LRR) protein